MIALIKKIIDINKIKLLIYVSIAALFNWMFVAFFPSVHEEAEKLEDAFSAYPEEMLKALNIEMTDMFSSLEAFMRVENFSFLWPIIAIILLATLGGAAIAGEVEDGTIEVLLAQPLSRAKVFFSKYIGGLIILLLFTIGSIFSVIPLAMLHNVDFQLESYGVVAVLCFLFGFAIYSLSIMLSSFFSSKGKAASLAAGTVLVMYALNILSTFKESVSDIKYLSFFHYYDFSSALIEHSIETLSVVVFVLFGVVCGIIGLLNFLKRDF